MISFLRRNITMNCMIMSRISYDEKEEKCNGTVTGRKGHKGG
jgi:hypothetical protein